MCHSKNQGGLGLRRIKPFNSALVAKQLWHFLCGEKEWGQILDSTYIPQVDKLCEFLNKDFSPPSGSFF